jgi:hypothetical protein
MSIPKPILKLDYNIFVKNKKKIAELTNVAKTTSFRDMFNKVFGMIDIDKQPVIYEFIERLEDILYDVDVDLKDNNNDEDDGFQKEMEEIKQERN